MTIRSYTGLYWTRPRVIVVVIIGSDKHSCICELLVSFRRKVRRSSSFFTYYDDDPVGESYCKRSTPFCRRHNLVRKTKLFVNCWFVSAIYKSCTSMYTRNIVVSYCIETLLVTVVFNEQSKKFFIPK
jgi:hypothetical protein